MKAENINKPVQFFFPGLSAGDFDFIASVSMLMLLMCMVVRMTAPP
jgi:hypothetical protein